MYSKRETNIISGNFILLYQPQTPSLILDWSNFYMMPSSSVSLRNLSCIAGVSALPFARVFAHGPLYYQLRLKLEGGVITNQTTRAVLGCTGLVASFLTHYVFAEFLCLLIGFHPANSLILTLANEWTFFLQLLSYKSFIMEIWNLGQNVLAVMDIVILPSLVRSVAIKKQYSQCWQPKSQLGHVY